MARIGVRRELPIPSTDSRRRYSTTGLCLSVTGASVLALSGWWTPEREAPLRKGGCAWDMVPAWSERIIDRFAHGSTVCYGERVGSNRAW